MKVKYHIAYLLLCNCILLLWACKPTTDYNATVKELSELTSSDTLVYINFSACFGTCPHFNAVIYGDLNMKYRGISHIMPHGKFQYDVPKSELVDIYAWAEKANFFNKAEQYPSDGQINDLPTLTIGLRGKNGIKTIKNIYAAPKDLNEFYDQIQKYVMTRNYQPLD